MSGASEPIRVLHTLGPAGTNLEMAANWWLSQNAPDGEVVLYETLEDAVAKMPKDGAHALLGCIVYPDLHTLVFTNLGRLTLRECFTFPTYAMVLAAKTELTPKSVISHPAPQSLIPDAALRIMTTSNAQAALDCLAGKADACITTAAAAREHGLVILRDFGPVSMGFSLHVPVRS
jgi:hypothetical protein